MPISIRFGNVAAGLTIEITLLTRGSNLTNLRFDQFDKLTMILVSPLDGVAIALLRA